MCPMFLFCFHTNDSLSHDRIEADLPRSNQEQCIESVNKLYTRALIAIFSNYNLPRLVSSFHKNFFVNFHYDFFVGTSKLQRKFVERITMFRGTFQGISLNA